MAASRRLAAGLLLLALASFLAPAMAPAQMGTSRAEQTFDYNPDDPGKAPELAKPVAEVTYEDAEMINHPVYGTIMLSKHRWKNWVARALYLVIINVALLVVILSLSKTEEYNIIISYVLCGSGATLSLWVLLCAILLAQLGARPWIYIGPISGVMVLVNYAVLLKVKRFDVSLSELKESFQKLRAASQEDPRLISVDGSPGDWVAEDFVR